MATFPDAIPTRQSPTVDPNGIGGPKTNRDGTMTVSDADRPKKLSADELENVLDNIIGMANGLANFAYARGTQVITTGGAHAITGSVVAIDTADDVTLTLPDPTAARSVMLVRLGAAYDGQIALYSAPPGIFYALCNGADLTNPGVPYRVPGDTVGGAPSIWELEGIRDATNGIELWTCSATTNTERLAGLLAGTIDATATIDATSGNDIVPARAALVRVTFGGGPEELLFSQAQIPVGKMTRVVKANSSAYPISVKGSATDTVNGGVAGDPMELPGSTAILSTASADPEWWVYRDSPTSLRVTAGNASATASGPAVLWEWNGTDLSQFDAAEGDAGFAWSVTTWSTRYTGLAGINDAPAIRCDSPNVAPRINFLPIKASELPATMPTRFAMVARMGCSDPNAVPMLICYWENSTHWFGAFRNVTQFVYSRRDNGAWSDSQLIQTVAGTVDVFHSGDYCKLTAHVVPATPAARPLVAVGLYPDNPTAPTKPNWYANSLQANYNASWLGLAHNARVGIACRAWNNAAVSPGHLWADLKIIEVP